MATAQSKATRKYEAKAGWMSKTYKLKREVVERFAQACEKQGVSQVSENDGRVHQGKRIAKYRKHSSNRVLFLSLLKDKIRIFKVLLRGGQKQLFLQVVVKLFSIFYL